MTKPEKYKKVYQNPPMYPVWESERRYSRIEIDNNYYVVDRPSIFWEDEQTGLITADPRKFEQWLDNLSSV